MKEKRNVIAETCFVTKIDDVREKKRMPEEEVIARYGR